ncbi:MAG: hypothetical protein IKU36_07935 [Bacteroidales bacterium]|nr:hypothetical protein [Bacteroidales bacterium]
MEKNDAMIAVLFTTATRKKFRFPFKGMISVEDLWDLSVQNLDAVFKALNAEAKVAKEESLLETKTEKDVILEAKIEIVKHIVKVKQAEAAQREQAAAVRAQKRKLEELIANKQDEALQGKSIEELQAMLSALDV